MRSSQNVVDPYSNLTGVLIRRQQVKTETPNFWREHSPAITLIPDFPNRETICSCCFKTLSLWYFVVVALAN